MRKVLPDARRLRPAERALLIGAGTLAWARAASKLRRPAAPPDAGAKESRAPGDESWSAMLRDAAAKWSEDEVPRRGAALAYYAVFSIAPLVLILMAIVGMVFGEDAAQGLVGERLRGVLGADKAHAIEGMVEGAKSEGAGASAGLIGAIMLLVGAGAVVGELQASMSLMWGTYPKAGGLGTLVKDRLLSMAFVLGIGFLLLVSLVLSSALAAAGKYMEGALPLPEAAFQALNHALGFGVITALFALMFKYLPKARIAWGDVWIGALFTAALFTGGNILLGLYLGKGGPTSSYGAAGSLLAFLLWTYYCAQIFYLGTEFTRIYAQRRGSGLPASPAAPPGA